MHAKKKKQKRAPERRSQGGPCDRERATKKRGKKGRRSPGAIYKTVSELPWRPNPQNISEKLRILKKIGGWSSIFVLKNTKSSKFIEDPQFFPSKNFEDPQNLAWILSIYPRSFGKEILKIFGGFILKIFWGCSAEKIFEDFLGRSEFPKIFRSPPQNPQNMVFSV